MARDKRKRGKTEKRKLREFGITVGVAFGVLASLLFWRGKDHYIYFAVLSAGFLVAGLVAARLLKPVHKAWMAGAMGMGWVMTRVILTILFYLVFTPIGRISQVFGKTFLRIDLDESLDTYWDYREAEQPDSADYERQF